MHVLMKNITITYTYPFLISNFFITCLISYHISYTFHVILHFTSCSCNRILSSYSSALLLISYHILYTSHLSFSFMFHACINLRSGCGKELYVPEGTITVRDCDLYLYDPNGVVIMIQTRSMSSTQTGPQYL